MIYYFWDSDNKLYNILNFIPQQIYFIIHKLIYKKFDKDHYVITNFDHNTHIYDTFILKKITLNLLYQDKNGLIYNKKIKLCLIMK